MATHCTPRQRLEHPHCFKKDSRGGKSTWCSPVDQNWIQRLDIVCSRGLVLSRPIKKLSGERLCVYRVGVLRMFLCVCVETGGPKASCWGRGAWLETQWDYSHSCLMCLCPLWWSVIVCKPLTVHSTWQFKVSRLVCLFTCIMHLFMLKT